MNVKVVMAVIIIVLTVFDAVATWYGVSSGIISEGNAIAEYLFQFNVPITCVIMVIWTGGLLWFISTKTYRWIPYAMAVVLIVKVYIAILHLTWLMR